MHDLIFARLDLSNHTNQLAIFSKKRSQPEIKSKSRKKLTFFNLFLALLNLSIDINDLGP